MYSAYRGSHAMDSKLLVNLTNEASVSGKIERALETEKPVYTFLGIPYAAPPVGERRFQPPAKLEYWTGTRDATTHGPTCPQDHEIFKMAHDPLPVPEQLSEDCLYLNIYTPDPDPNKKYPVMFWIYGGAFFVGMSDCYNGTALAPYHDVVVVTINYRLGIFGFLCTGEDGVVNGNAGLLDQIAALQWVQQHITKFGGDPNNVTIFGESAGAMSVSMLIASDLTKGLFHRAISQSGVCTYPGLLKTQDYAKKSLRRHLAQEGFTSTDSQEIVAYLKSLSTEDLNNLQGDLFCMSVILDHNVLKDNPENIYDAKLYQHVDYMIGFNANEGAMGIFLKHTNPQITKEEAQKYVKDVIEIETFKEGWNQAKITEAVCKKYVDDRKDQELKQSMIDLYGDMGFVAPSIEIADQHSETNQTFVYLFDHHSALSKLPDWVKGDHGEETVLALGAPFVESPKWADWTEEDKKISIIMMKYWTNFAKTGNPNGDDLPKWPLYTKQEKKYMILGDQLKVGSDYKPNIVEFWQKTVPDIMKSTNSETN